MLSRLICKLWGHNTNPLWECLIETHTFREIPTGHQKMRRTLLCKRCGQIVKREYTP